MWLFIEFAGRCPKTDEIARIYQDAPANYFVTIGELHYIVQHHDRLLLSHIVKSVWISVEEARQAFQRYLRFTSGNAPTQWLKEGF